MNSLTDTSGWKYPFKVGYKVEWPNNIVHEEQIWWNTGSEDTNNEGVPSCKYQNETRSNDYVWLLITGEVQKEKP